MSVAEPKLPIATIALGLRPLQTRRNEGIRHWIVERTEPRSRCVTTENGESTQKLRTQRCESICLTRESTKEGGRQNVLRLCILPTTGVHINSGLHLVRWLEGGGAT